MPRVFYQLRGNVELAGQDHGACAADRAQTCALGGAPYLRFAVGKETLEIALDESIQFSPKRNAMARSKRGWNTVQCQYIGQQLSAYCRVRH